MKKVLCLAISLMMMIAMLGGCGEKDTDTEKATPTPTKVVAATATTAPEDPEEPEVPETDPNLFISVDMDTDNAGTFITGSEYALPDPDQACLYFSGMGNSAAEFSEGKGVDGSNCLKVAGRSAEWNGISITVPAELFGKGLKVSYDAMFESETITAGTISLTSKFLVDLSEAKDGSETKENYPAYNRAQAACNASEWTHVEGTLYFPTDVYVDEMDGATVCVIYFELPESTDDFYLDNIKFEVVEGIGDFATMESKKADLAAANGITLPEE